MPFHDRVYLLDDLLHVLCESFRSLGTNVHILHLRSLGISLELIGFGSLIFVTKESIGKLAQEVLDNACILAVIVGRYCPFKLLQFRLSGLVREFAHDGVKEVHASKRAGYNGVERPASPLDMDLGIATDMGKYVAFAHFDQYKLDVIGMRRVILW